MKKYEYMFSKVPNNLIGKLFLWYFKRKFNYNTYELRVRGQNLKKGIRRANPKHTKLSEARTLRIYVERKYVPAENLTEYIYNSEHWDVDASQENLV